MSKRLLFESSVVVAVAGISLAASLAYRAASASAREAPQESLDRVPHVIARELERPPQAFPGHHPQIFQSSRINGEIRLVGGVIQVNVRAFAFSRGLVRHYAWRVRVLDEGGKEVASVINPSRSFRVPANVDTPSGFAGSVPIPLAPGRYIVEVAPVPYRPGRDAIEALRHVDVVGYISREIVVE